MAKAKRKVQEVQEQEVVQEQDNKETKVQGINLTKEQQKEFDAFETKSAKIRYLGSLNYTPGPIAKFMNIKYQHARNVLTTPLKRA